ncbi:hypothetical protein BJY01DRAFT_59075 [Aspergillus pseudoustus]|uniref:Zn(2)-C6 fungal-type domain-containing protein n=1 Tax=Aspergillus pseudoustus TaxID=1810923 RepID=A0ABR4JB92_9EURO
MSAILSPTKASRDTRNNSAAVDALNPPPPLPSLMIARDVGRHWSDSRPRPAAVTTGLHGLAPTLDAVNDATEVVGNQMLVLPDFDLQTHGGMSLSCTQYPTSWKAPLLGAQSAFDNQHSSRMPNSYDFSPGSVSSERGDPVAMRLDYGRPTRSSSSASSSWVMSMTGSESDSSVATDEEQDDMAAEMEEQISNVVNAPPRGPCSKTWSLPPRTRRKRKSTVEDSTKRKHRKSGGTRRRGPFKDDRKRRNTALTRILKGCIRCRMMRIRCEPDKENLGGDCLTCQRSHHSKALSVRKLPCLRWIITDVSLYREQDMPCQLFSRRWQSMDLIDITEWASSETKTITLSQICVDAPYDVEVREFVPMEGDMLESTWVSGSFVKRHRMPMYALVSMESAATTLKWLTQKYVGKYIVQTIGNLDLLIWTTYFFAFEYQTKAKTLREKALIVDCLKFWVGCRKISNPERICSYETLGGTPVDDPSSPFHGVVPMPSIMIPQMECIMYTRVLRPLSNKVLSALKDLIMENKREHWLTIYLTLFILLHSCAMLTRRDWETAREFGLQDEYANLVSIQGMQTGMRTMLAHFHYLNKGVLPFHMTYDEESLRNLGVMADLNSAELNFVKQTSAFVNDHARRAHMAEIRSTVNFGADLYWISQLYDSDWTPGSIA